jgi:hypothetical protein
MSVKLNIKANVTGSNQVDSLNKGLANTNKNAKSASRGLRDLEKVAKKGRASIAGLSTALSVGLAAGFAAVTAGTGKFIKDTFEAGNTVESLGIRFKLLFGSVEEGAKAFDTLTDFAAKVPFSLEEISKGSGNLAVISEDAGQLNKILEITGNVAAATGLDFQQTATQIQRSFAGGIASADIFRERGVRAMLGFEAGAKVSVEETKKRFFEVFGKGGQFGNATKELANTLTGQVSMVQDKYFKFRQIVSKEFFGSLTAQIRNLNGELEGQEAVFDKLAKQVGEQLAIGFKKLETAIRFIVANFENIATAVKAFIAFKLAGVVLNIAVAFGTLNKVMRANPLGLIITALQLGTAAFIAFEDQIKDIANKTMTFVIEKFNSLATSVVNLIEKLNVLPFVNIDLAVTKGKLAAQSDRLAQSVDGIAASYTNLSKAQKAAFSGGMRKQNKDLSMGKDPTRIMAMSAEKRANDNPFKSSVAITEMQKASKKAMEEQLKNQRAVVDGFNNGITSAMKKATDVTKNYEKVGNDVFENLTDGIARFVQGGSFGFADMAKDFINQIIRMETKFLASKLIEGIRGGGSSTGSGGGFGSLFNIGKKILGFNKGGIVPGGAPYTDRVPAMLTPGEVVIPRNKVGKESGSTNITNINISGNVDQRSIDQIKAVIASSSAEVGGANRTYQSNTRGVRGRNI